MRKYYVFTLILALTLFLAACGASQKISVGNTPEKTAPAKQGQNINQPGAAKTSEVDNQINKSESNVTSTDKASDKPAVTTEKPKTTTTNGVITKSDNPVSNAEKEQVLKDLDTEISGTLNDLDGLDDVSDTDLAE